MSALMWPFPSSVTRAPVSCTSLLDTRQCLRHPPRPGLPAALVPLSTGDESAMSPSVGQPAGTLGALL